MPFEKIGPSDLGQVYHVLSMTMSYKRIDMELSIFVV